MGLWRPADIAGEAYVMAYGGELRCDRCHRPYEGQVDWTFVMKGGQLIEVICSECGAEHEVSREAGRDTRSGG
jgi:hypothetical protein